MWCELLCRVTVYQCCTTVYGCCEPIASCHDVTAGSRTSLAWRDVTWTGCIGRGSLLGHWKRYKLNLIAWGFEAGKDWYLQSTVMAPVKQPGPQLLYCHSIESFRIQYILETKHQHITYKRKQVTTITKTWKYLRPCNFNSRQWGKTAIIPAYT